MALAGCAGFVDEVTSRDFHMKNLFVKPNPLIVLANSTDGNQRAKALRALGEPLQHGGTEKDQDLMIQLLTTAATSDREPLCRLAAIKSLGHYKDPRAVEGLRNAYLEAKPFAPETNTIIAQQALAGLGQTGNAAARDLLVRVAGEPPPAADRSDMEKQLAMDLRLTAVRALANPKFSHYEVTETLVKVMQAEKDVALRDRAHESLQVVTGKKLPPDAKAWDDLLHQQPARGDDALAQETGRKWNNVLGWR